MGKVAELGATGLSHRGVVSLGAQVLDGLELELELGLEPEFELSDPVGGVLLIKPAKF